MHANNKRRTFLKKSLLVGAFGTAIGTGLLTTQSALASWSKPAFEAKNTDDVAKDIFGTSETIHSDDIKIKAPDIAENGAVVPITINASAIEGAESIAILAAENNQPLASVFSLENGLVANISTRIKMGKTGDVVAMVKVGDKVYSNTKNVKVTIGGCGG